MKLGLKPASAKARAMLRKLQALADRGVDGEKLAAQRKIDRLKARFNFDAPATDETPDLFSGSFKRSTKARRIYSFQPSEFDVANAVKWAIEGATGIRCLYRDRDLLAEASASTANRLVSISDHITQSFRTLTAKFVAVKGVGIADRGVFVMGLYDGMMNDPRQAGQSLPSRAGVKGRKRGKKAPLITAADVHIHPYTLAVGLGRQIRFSIPLQEISAELENLTQARLGNGAPTPIS